MKNTMFKLVLAGLMMGLTVLPGQGVLAQEESVNKTIALTGKLVAVDLEKSTITVEQASGDAEQGTDSVVLFVEHSTMIEKAEGAVTINELVVGQTVTVEGMVNESGELTAWYVRVE